MLRALVSGCPVGAARVDRDGRTSECNATMAELLGRGIDTLRGAALGAALSEGAARALEAALRGDGESVSYDGPLRDPPLRALTASTAGGAHVVAAPASTAAAVSLGVWPVRGAGGSIEGALLVAVDRSPQRAAEDALRESEKRYRELVELSPEPIFVHADRRFLYANPAALRAFGVATPADIVGRPTAAFIHPDEVENVRARLSRVESGLASEYTEHRYCRADGSTGYAEVASIPMEFQGRPAVLTVARDITERKRAELRAHAYEQRLRAQFKAIPVPTYAWQRVERGGGADVPSVEDVGPEEFVLVDYNDAAVVITAGNIPRLVGTTLTAMYGDQPIANDIRRCLRERVTLHRDMEYAMMSTGKTKHLAVTYLPAPPDLVLCYTDDISERQKLEEQLRHAQKMEAVGRLAGGVAHDFNNLLTVIQSFADGLSRDLGADHPKHDDVEEIRKAAVRAATLTRSLLAFGRKQVLLPRSIDLGEVIADLEPMLRRLLGSDIEMRVTRAPSLPPVHADPGQIEEVIVNLAVNARDAMPGGGTLTVETAPADGATVRISVSDTGHGMDPDTQRHAFEPFFSTREGQGAGLGLATVHGIVVQSGGSVRVTSAPGAGTTFDVFLPRARAEAPPRSTESLPPRVSAGGETILLVEDEAAVRAATKRILERAGYAVTEASDGRCAIQVAAEMTQGIDLLLTDVSMPGLTGPQVYRELAALRPGLRVLYVSGYADDDMFQRGMLVPGSAFLQKPFVGRALLEKVRAVLDAAEERVRSA